MLTVVSTESRADSILCVFNRSAYTSQRALYTLPSLMQISKAGRSQACSTILLSRCPAIIHALYTIRHATDRTIMDPFQNPPLAASKPPSNSVATKRTPPLPLVLQRHFFELRKPADFLLRQFPRRRRRRNASSAPPTSTSKCQPRLRVRIRAPPRIFLLSAFAVALAQLRQHGKASLNFLHGVFESGRVCQPADVFCDQAQA
jgi:hypothetical protein